MQSQLPVQYWIVGGVLVALAVFFLVYAFKGHKPTARPVRRPFPPPPASRPMGQRYVSSNQRMTATNQPVDRGRVAKILDDPEKTLPVARRPVSAPPRGVRR